MARMAARRLGHLDAQLAPPGARGTTTTAAACTRPHTHAPTDAGAVAAAAAAGSSGSPTTITSVRCYAIKLPDIRMITVVKIETAGGLYGVGESGLSFRELAVKGAAGGDLPNSCCHSVS